MHVHPNRLPAAALEFLAERHLASLTSLRRDGSPHVVAVGFTWAPAECVARIITSAGTQKAVNAARGSALVLCQIDGARWLALEGVGRVSANQFDVTDAERRYAERYRPPRANPQRVVIEIRVIRVLGSRGLLIAKA